MTVESQQQINPFLEQLLKHGLLISSPSLGVYGRSEVFEGVVTRLENLITANYRTVEALGGRPEVMRFPPVISSETTERSGYMKSFPQLLGVVHSFTGDHHQHRQLLKDMEDHHDWTHHLSSAGVVLTPAACYPVYGVVAGTLPEGGRLVDVSSYCFRHEPSLDPARMQSFRMREFVRIADPQTVQDWHRYWLTQGEEFLSSIGLEPVFAPANDPFFGPGGRLLAASQQEQNLKYELLAPAGSDKPTTAIMSINYHQDHFGHDFSIFTPDGNIAHTACVGFGLERITLALFRAHGFDVTQWPAEVREKLWSNE
jgi:seryl-tRNA synthetase